MRLIKYQVINADNEVILEFTSNSRESAVKRLIFLFPKVHYFLTIREKK